MFEKLPDQRPAEMTKTAFAGPLATVRSQHMTTTNPAAQAVATPPAPVLQTRAETDAEIRALFLSQNPRADQADILVNRLAPLWPCPER